MEFNEYRQVYLNFELATSQTRLISLAAGETLQDFPKNLPEKTQDILYHLITKFSNILGGIVDKNSEPRETDLANAAADNKANSDTPFFQPVLQIILANFYSDREVMRINVDNLLYAQELIMLFAHLDAFMSDSIRTMCRKEPRLLYRDKKMSWKAILESGDWENVVEKMIEEYSYDFGWKSIKERVRFLQSEHGLFIETPPNELDDLDNAEKIRHIVIHNGSRVSQEYLERTKRTDVRIGEIIPISPDYLKSVNGKVRMLGSDLFISIAKKIFQISDENLSGVWRRNKHKSIRSA
jgi:hypothetical protein